MKITAEFKQDAMSTMQLSLVAEVEGVFVGVVWRRIDAATPTIAHVFQLCVAPASPGRACAEQLLSDLIAWANAMRRQCVALSVASGIQSRVDSLRARDMSRW